MSENDTHFSSKKSERVRNTTDPVFFWYFKISWKIMDFWYQNLHSTKKSWWKNDFSQITHIWSDIDFMDFWKKSIFCEIFCSNLHFKKKTVFFVVFLNFFFAKRFVILLIHFFFDCFGFFVKNVLSIEREVIFFRFQKKNSNWTPVWEGGAEEKFIFQNQLFGLLVVKPKVHFFHNRYRRLRVNGFQHTKIKNLQKFINKKAFYSSHSGTSKFTNFLNW